VRSSCGRQRVVDETLSSRAAALGVAVPFRTDRGRVRTLWRQQGRGVQSVIVKAGRGC
jgi:hypothetical protein